MSIVTRPARLLIRRAVRRYGPGPDLTDALEIARRVRDQGLGTILGFWDPPGITPALAVDAAMDALDAAEEEDLDAHVSVKAPAFGPPWQARSLVSELVDRAALAQARLHFDALGPETAVPTMGLLRRLNRTGADIGCTLPAGWPRSVRDGDRAVELDLGVRIVRGQWSQLDRDDETRAFLRLSDHLAGRARHVALATHDPDLVAGALPVLRELGTPCEVQLLYGLPGGKVRRIAEAFGVPVRVYVPWGRIDLPYDPAHARDSARVAWWLARDAFSRREGALGWTLEGA